MRTCTLGGRYDPERGGSAASGAVKLCFTASRTLMMAARLSLAAYLLKGEVTERQSLSASDPAEPQPYYR